MTKKIKSIFLVFLEAMEQAGKRKADYYIKHRGYSKYL